MQASRLRIGLAGALTALLLGAGTPVLAAPTFMDGQQLASDAGAQNAQVQALQAIIQKADNEQAQAFSQNNPAVMQDTSTSGYYQQLVQINSDMAANGVTGIKLDNIDWGQGAINGSRAQLNAYETWTTTYSDGTTDQSRDRNVYQLVNQNGTWLISGDAHPDSEIEIPVPGTIPAPNPGVTPGQGESRNWSGYEATGGTFTAVSGTWTVPTTSGTTPGADATWVGIGGVRSQDLIQAGTESDASGAGQVRYSAWIETLPRASRTVALTVNPGDSVSVSIAQQATNQWLVTLKDNTTGQTYQTTDQYTSSHSSAEWVEEAPSGGRRVLPLDNFGSVSFSGATATKDGQSQTISQLNGQPITMIDSAGQPIATPGSLGADGQSFTVTRSNASSTPSVVTTIPGFTVIPGSGRSPFGRGGAVGTSDPFGIGGLNGFGLGRRGR